jgi:hypothetical protein
VPLLDRRFRADLVFPVQRRNVVFSHVKSMSIFLSGQQNLLRNGNLFAVSTPRSWLGRDCKPFFEPLFERKPCPSPASPSPLPDLKPNRMAMGSVYDPLRHSNVLMTPYVVVLERQQQVSAKCRQQQCRAFINTCDRLDPVLSYELGQSSLRHLQ